MYSNIIYIYIYTIYLLYIIVNINQFQVQGRGDYFMYNQDENVIFRRINPESTEEVTSFIK